MNVGEDYIYKGVRSKLVSKWAQGKWNTFTFADGRSFNGDPEPMFKNGDLKKCEIEDFFETPPLKGDRIHRGKAKEGKMPNPTWNYTDGQTS